MCDGVHPRTSPSPKRDWQNLPCPLQAALRSWRRKEFSVQFLPSSVTPQSNMCIFTGRWADAGGHFKFRRRLSLMAASEGRWYLLICLRMQRKSEWRLSLRRGKKGIRREGQGRQKMRFVFAFSKFVRLCSSFASASSFAPTDQLSQGPPDGSLEACFAQKAASSGLKKNHPSPVSSSSKAFVQF